jgi:hypothetical protein
MPIVATPLWAMIGQQKEDAMKRIGLLALALVAVFALVGTAAAERLNGSDHGGRPLATTLSGANEVNAEGVPNQGDPDGSGVAVVTLNQGQGEVCINMTLSNIAPPTMAHIHAAPAGTNGPIVVNFTPLISGFSVNGCVSADPALIKQIRQHPELYYVNAHNVDFPAGAVRGQLAK